MATIKGTITISVEIDADEDSLAVVSPDNFIQEMDYNIISRSVGLQVVNTEVLDYELEVETD
jgi:hypothetical protein